MLANYHIFKLSEPYIFPCLLENHKTPPTLHSSDFLPSAKTISFISEKDKEYTLGLQDTEHIRHTQEDHIVYVIMTLKY